MEYIKLYCADKFAQKIALWKELLGRCADKTDLTDKDLRNLEHEIEGIKLAAQRLDWRIMEALNR